MQSGNHHPHAELHFESSVFVRDIVIGMADGLTVPFALAAGLSGAVDQNGIIITAGLAEICAGSIAMGLGGYMAGKTEIDHYKSELAREYREVETFHEKEKEEVREALAVFGITSNTQHLVADELAKDKDKWVAFMMRYELGLEKPDQSRARKSAFNIGVAYIIGGIIPLTGYIFSDDPQAGLLNSSMMTVICLLLFGYFKSKMIGQEPLAGALKTTAIGIIAALVAYLIASLF